jgi:hypothetical protein
MACFPEGRGDARPAIGVLGEAMDQDETAGHVAMVP